MFSALRNRVGTLASVSERVRDRRGLPATDPGPARAAEQALAWLCRAQDHSASADGGVARHYSLRSGWAPSYPETTGYIAPTFLAWDGDLPHLGLAERARRMLDWLVSIQFPEGGFQGGMIGQEPRVPVTFNTGQILFGLAAGQAAFGAYAEPLRRAADWLAQTQDPDGAWRRHPTPFAAPGEKVYETHVAWGLLEAARQVPESRYADVALANVRWALGHQQENGWLARCCLTDPDRPLTHTIGYALRGVVEAHRFAGGDDLLEAARRCADGALSALRPDGFLPGRIDADWRGATRWACLTGTVQIAHCWLLLYEATGDSRYRDAAYAANRYVRRTQRMDGPEDTRGGVKGSFPVDGGYGTDSYLNWAAKFLTDAQRAEQEVRAREA